MENDDSTSPESFSDDVDVVNQFVSAHLLATISALIGYSTVACAIALVNGYYDFADVLAKAFSLDQWFLPYGLAIASLCVVRACSRRWYHDRMAIGVLSTACICFTLTLLLVCFLRIASQQC